MSGAPQVFVTGSPGVGKTTLITKVLDKLRESHPGLNVQGFYTKEVRSQGERQGFEVITVQGCRATLASIHGGAINAPMVGRYKVDVAGFEAVALPEMELKEETQLFVLDEIGKMELFSPAFFPAVEAVCKASVPILVSVSLKHHSYMQKASRDYRLYTIHKNNRDRVAKEILAVFEQHMNS